MMAVYRRLDSNRRGIAGRKPITNIELDGRFTIDRTCKTGNLTTPAVACA